MPGRVNSKWASHYRALRSCATPAQTTMRSTQPGRRAIGRSQLEPRRQRHGRVRSRPGARQLSRNKRALRNRRSAQAHSDWHVWRFEEAANRSPNSVCRHSLDALSQRSGGPTRKRGRGQGIIWARSVCAGASGDLSKATRRKRSHRLRKLVAP